MLGILGYNIITYQTLVLFQQEERETWAMSLEPWGVIQEEKKNDDSLSFWAQLHFWLPCFSQISINPIIKNYLYNLILLLYSKSFHNLSKGQVRKCV